MPKNRSRKKSMSHAHGGLAVKSGALTLAKRNLIAVQSNAIDELEERLAAVDLERRKLDSMLKVVLRERAGLSPETADLKRKLKERNTQLRAARLKVEEVESFYVRLVGYVRTPVGLADLVAGFKERWAELDAEGDSAVGNRTEGALKSVFDDLGIKYK